MTKYYFNLKIESLMLCTDTEFHSGINLHDRHLETITDYKADY